MYLYVVYFFQPECNTYACSFDNLECSLNVFPYQNCSAIKHGILCYNKFKDGVCDKACASEECLFDGFDCEKPVQECNPVYDAYCSNHFANGHCDKGCNNEECNWDGLDCEAGGIGEPSGGLIIIVKMPPSQFRSQLVRFLRQLGSLLHGVAKIKQYNGEDMIYNYFPDAKSTSGKVKRSIHEALDIIIPGRVKRAANSW